MPGDNFHVAVHGEGRTHFEMAVCLAFGNAPGGKATHFISPIPELSCTHCSGGKSGHWIEKSYCEYTCQRCRGTGKRPAHAGMVLLWHEGSIGGVNASPLPFPLMSEAAAEFLWRYLETAEYADQPDHDGSNGKGFIVTTGDFWGHIGGSHYTVVAPARKLMLAATSHTFASPGK